MVEKAREGPTEARGEPNAFVACTGELRSTRAVLAVHSPVFTSRRRLDFELVYSTVAVFRHEGDARRFIAAVSGARARACIERDYRRALLHLAARRGRLHVGDLALTVLPTPAPRTYRGLGPYNATALRITTQARYTTRRGRQVSFPIYAQSFEFAFGRAVVELAAFSGPHPFPDANEQFLEAALVGRTEARAG